MATDGKIDDYDADDDGKKVKNGDEDEDEEGEEDESGRGEMMTRADKEGEGKRERKRKREKERENTDMVPNTYAPARTTLEITIGCLCQVPSRRFQGACRLSTRKKITCPTVRLFDPCLQDGSNEMRKKNACM